MKPQKTMSSLKKKKFGFKKSKQKFATTPVMAPEISRLSIVDAGPRILLDRPDSDPDQGEGRAGGGQPGPPQ